MIISLSTETQTSKGHQGTVVSIVGLFHQDPDCTANSGRVGVCTWQSLKTLEREGCTEDSVFPQLMSEWPMTLGHGEPLA